MGNEFKAVLELAACNRDLAKRARLLGDKTHDDLSRLRLERYATELEYEALKLEQAAARPEEAMRPKRHRIRSRG